MPLQDLTTPPTAPNRSMANDDFILAADAWVAWVATFVSQLTTLTAQLEATAALINVAPEYADPDLLAIAALSTTAFGRSLLEAVDGPDAHSILDLSIGADVQAWNTNLDALAGQSTTAFGRALLDVADAAALRTNLDVYSTSEVDTAVAAAVPAGTVITVAMSSAPTGWLKCDGSSVLRATYASLFTAIGTTFGSADGTHFTLPDLRGEFVRGYDDGRGIDSGRVFGSSQGDLVKAHTHTVAAGGGSSQIEAGGGGTGSSFNTGSTGGAENRPRNVALLYCIKT